MRFQKFKRPLCILLACSFTGLFLAACSPSTSNSASSVSSIVTTLTEEFLFSDESLNSSEESISEKASESNTLDDNETVRYTVPDVTLYELPGQSYYFFKDSKMIRAVFQSSADGVDDCADLISKEFDSRESYHQSTDSQSQYSTTWLSNDTKVTLFNTLGVLTLAYFPIDETEDVILSTEESSSELTTVTPQDGDFRVAHWGDTIEMIKNAESANYLGTASDDAGTTLIYEGKVAGNNANIVYYFDTDGKLYQGVYDLSESYNQGSIYISIYDTLKDALSSKYGDPSTDEIVKNSHLADRTDEGTALSLGYTLYRSHWETETLDIYMGMSSINYDTFITIQYIDPHHEEVKNTTGL